MYEIARAGEEIELESRPVTIHQFEMIDEPQMTDGLMIVKAKIKCSSGTYIRALARDLGEKLGTSGYLKNLQRTAIGDYKIEKSIELKDLNKDNWTDHLIHVSLHE